MVEDNYYSSQNWKTNTINITLKYYQKNLILT